MIALASEFDIEVPKKGEVFDILWVLAQKMLGVDDDQLLLILKQRTFTDYHNHEKQLKQFDAFKDILTADEREALDKLQTGASSGAEDLKAFKEKWGAKRDALLEATPKMKVKKGKALGAPLTDIEEVCMRAKAKLPTNAVSQQEAAAFLPPGASIWKSWRGESWSAHLPPSPRDSEPWAIHGRDGAGFTLTARLWRQWLADRDMPDEDCPVADLLQNW